MTIGRVVTGRTHEVIHCTPETSVREAANLLAERRIGALPVIERGSVAGIFSERDFLYCVLREGPSVLDRPVGEVMTAPAITVDFETRVLDALALMTRRRIRHLPVVEKGVLAGFVSIGDLVKQRLDQIESEAEAMRAYIQAA